VALRTVGVRLAAEVSGYVNGLRTAKAATQDFVGQLDKAAKAGKLDAVADQAARMGLGLVAAFGVAVGAAARFDKQMSEVAAVSGATASEMERLRKSALQAGKDTAFSATEAAKAEAELAKAGLSSSQILGGALTGSLDLAAAGTLDLADAAEIAAKTMNMFQLQGKDVGHIADVLAAAANKSATDVHEMGEALKMSGLASRNAGMSLEETVGTLAAFADRALAGSDGGTSLKTALMMLQAPSEKAANLMKELGINAYDAGGNFVGTARLAGILQERLGGMTQEQRNAALATIFGADAMRAATVLYDVGEQGIRDYTAAVNDQGAASEVAAKKMDNLAGDVEKLKGSLETLGIESGSGANAGLRTVVQGLDALVGQLSSLPPIVGSAGVVLAGLTGTLLLGFAAWVKSRRAMADAMAELRQMGPTGAKAATGIEATTKWAGRAAAAFVALEVAAAGLRAAAGQDLNPQVDALAKGLEDWARNGEKSGEAARLLGDDFEHLSYDVQALDTGALAKIGNGIAGVVEGFTGMGSVMDESLEHAKERLAAIDQALTQMVTSGNGEAAAEVFNKIAAEAEKQGVSVDELKKGLPGYSAALETATGKSQEGAAAISDVGTSAKEAAEQVEALKQAFDDLFDVQMSLDEATIKYSKGIVDLKKELTEGARTLKVNSEEGRTNRQAVLDQIQAIKDLRDARIDHGETLDDANGKYVKDIDGLRRTMLQLGYTRAEVEELIGKYRQIPKQASTAIVTPGMTTAIERTRALRLELERTQGRYSVEVIQHFRTYGGMVNPHLGLGNRWGGITEHAQSGLLREAATFTPQGPARYAFAEPATGGEAFIPKRGDYGRSMGILSRAAGWYGAQVVPGRASGGTQRLVVTLQWPDGSVAGQIVANGFTAPGSPAVSALNATLTRHGGPGQALGLDQRYVRR
jgi:TP901 family phage tail tape measure protein